MILPIRSPFGAGEDSLFQTVEAVDGVVGVHRPSLNLRDRLRGEAGAPGPDAPGTQTPQQLLVQPAHSLLPSPDSLWFRCTVPVRGKEMLQVAPSPLSSRDGPWVRCTVGRTEGAGWSTASVPPLLPRESCARDILCLREELPVAGRLREFLPFWEEITKDQWVLDIIR